MDIWDSVENPTLPQQHNEFWGQVSLDVWFCVLERGVGKVQFNPSVHQEDRRRTAIDIIIQPMEETGVSFPVRRSMIAESHEWASFTLPSIRDLSFSPKQLNGAWVKVQTVPLTDKAGNVVTYTDGNGAVKEKTALKFLAIFKDEAECRADYQANSSNPAFQNTEYAGEQNGSGNKERETALAFLKVYVQNACRGQKDLNVIRETLALNIAQQPLISKYFTADSPETVQLIAENMK